MQQNQNETIITSAGIIRNASKPRVGVINASSLYNDLFQECLDHGVDLDFEDFRLETLESLRTNNPDADETELDALLDEALQDSEIESRVFLLGAWIKNAQGLFEIDRSGNSGTYALQYNVETGIVCVEWSQDVTRCHYTSPCYVMADGSGPCGDLDTPGNSVVAYTLPADLFETGG